MEGSAIFRIDHFTNTEEVVQYTGGTAKKSEKPAARSYRGEYTMLVCEA